MNRFLKVITYIAILALLVPTYPAQIFALEQSDFEESVERVLIAQEELDQDILLFDPNNDSTEIAKVSQPSIGIMILEDESQSVVSLPLDSFDVLEDSDQDGIDLESLYDVEHDSYHFLINNEDIIKESDSDIDFDKFLEEHDNDVEDNTDSDIEEDLEITDEELPSNDPDLEDDNLQSQPNDSLDASQEDLEDVEDIILEENQDTVHEEIVDIEEDQISPDINMMNEQDVNSDDTKSELLSQKKVRSTSNIDFTSLKSVEAIALKQPTRVYSSTSKNATVLKSYTEGSFLKIRQYSNNWYAARVFVKGKATWGYIATGDVDKILAEKRINGQSNVQSAKVYTSPSRNSKVLKGYANGKRVIYRTYTSNWHTAQVYINGKPIKGYIHVNDVIPQPTYKAIAAVQGVSVYQSMSKSSKKLKTYKEGHVITYRKNDANWHFATVYINGKPKSGYIFAKDLEDITETQTSMQKYGLKNPTKVYSSPSNSATTLKSYKQGHLLKFHTYTDSWYRTTVYVNGKANTGYIHKNDVGDVKPSSAQKLQGFAVGNKTNVYTNATSGSEVLKSYKPGSFLKFRSYSNEWFEATVYINGKAHVGYINKNDVVVTSNKKIVLDAGHGGYDPGASANNLFEKDLTLDITKRVQALLISKGYKVLMTRSDDRYISLKDRTNYANQNNADIMVSIHINSGGGTGIETWKMNAGPNPAKSTMLATHLQNHMIETTKVSNRGIKDGNLHINRESNMPSSLVEVGFIDHPLDSVLLKQNQFKENAAIGISNGINTYFQTFN